MPPARGALSPGATEAAAPGPGAATAAANTGDALPADPGEEKELRQANVTLRRRSLSQQGSELFDRALSPINDAGGE